MIALLSVIGSPFMPDWLDLRPFAGELCLIVTMVAVLLAPFFPRRGNRVCPAVALLGLGAALTLTICIGIGPDVAGEYFRGLLVYDGTAFLWKILLLIFTGGVVLMWYATLAMRMADGDAAEFFLLLLGATLGMCLMVSTGNLLMLFMSVELASLPSYVLAGFRKTHRLGAEAALKYVLFGAACSSFMVYGLSMLYGMYGTLQLHDIAAAMSAGGAPPALAMVAFLGLLVGIGFKIAAVPFHFWCPDVFEGAGVDVTLFLSVASKGAGLLLLVRVAQSFAEAYQFRSDSALLMGIAVTLSIIGILTATAGNTGAYVQTNMKRLLAYSSIAHAGYMLCAAAIVFKSLDTPAGYDPALLPVQALLVYLVVYLLMNLGAFTVVGVVFNQTGSELMDDYRGLGKRSPVMAFCMALFLISLIGIPPLAGFWAKINIMAILIGNGHWWWAPAVAIGLNTILSLYFYLRIIKRMYLEESEQPSLRPAPLAATIVVICAVMLVALFIGWGVVMETVGRVSWLG
jgi:NADH-quinone oxidoreductase subunit N